MTVRLRDAVSSADDEKHRKIRLAKLEEISKAWNDLFFILAGEEVFKKIPGVSDYPSFERSMRLSLEEAKEDPFPVTNPPGDLLDRLDGLLSLDYSPPQAGEDMAGDLISLQDYYRGYFFHPIVEMALDLSLCKLIRAVCALHAAAQERGVKTLSPTKAKKTKAVLRKTNVLEAFYQIDNKRAKNKSFDWVAETIRNILERKNETAEPDELINIPVKRTIKRDLENDEKALKDLIALGIIKDRTGSVK